MVRALIAIILLASTAAVAVDIDPTRSSTSPIRSAPTRSTGRRRSTSRSTRYTAATRRRGYWYEANNYWAAEHGGTHMDAPVHFARGGATADQVPVTAGIGPLVRVDVSAQAARDADYRLTRADLEAWEKANGRIPKGAIVVMYSGWGSRWPDAKRYLGTDVAGDVANLHFPSFSQEAAEFLVRERDINGIGVDTASIDYGPSTDFIVHRVINGAGKPGFENLAHLDRVPAKGATLIACRCRSRWVGWAAARGGRAAVRPRLREHR
jgi:kynurenine formamidase